MPAYNFSEAELVVLCGLLAEHLKGSQEARDHYDAPAWQLINRLLVKLGIEPRYSQDEAMRVETECFDKLSDQHVLENSAMHAEFLLDVQNWNGLNTVLRHTKINS